MADEEKVEEVCSLPNGFTLYRKPNGIGGHLYLSDEVPGGVEVWDTSIVAESTLLATMAEEWRRAVRERVSERKASN